MTTNAVVILLSLLWLGVTGAVCHRRWQAARFDLADLYILMVGVFYGGVALVEASLADLGGYEPRTVVTVYILLATSLVGVRLLMSRLPERLKGALRLNRIAGLAAETSVWSLVAVAGLMGLLTLYGIRRYGVLSDSDVRLVPGGLPYLFTSAKQIEYSGLIQGLFVAAWTKSLIGRGMERCVALIVSVAMLFLAATWGRTVEFEVLLLGLVLWSLARRSNPFALRAAVRWMVVLGMMFVASNIYQTYREYWFDPIALRLGIDKSDKRLAAAAGDWQTTVRNVAARGADWDYDYTVLRAIERQGPQEGLLLAHEIENHIPLFMWPTKQYVNPDLEFDELYGYNSNYTSDYNTNLLGVTLIDFGYLAVAIFALLMAGAFAVGAAMLNLLKGYRGLYVIMAGLTLDSVLRIETSYAGVIGLMRWAILMLGCYGLAVLWRALRPINGKLVTDRAAAAAGG
jgi:hypothetical protein